MTETTQPAPGADEQAPCVMKQEPPYDFGWCETHDTTFPLGAACKFHGRSVAEVLVEEVDVLRGRAVLAEGMLARTGVQFTDEAAAVAIIADHPYNRASHECQCMANDDVDTIDELQWAQHVLIELAGAGLLRPAPARSVVGEKLRAAVAAGHYTGVLADGGEHDLLALAVEADNAADEVNAWRSTMQDMARGSASLGEARDAAVTQLAATREQLDQAQAALVASEEAGQEARDRLASTERALAAQRQAQADLEAEIARQWRGVERRFAQLRTDVEQARTGPVWAIEGIGPEAAPFAVARTPQDAATIVTRLDKAMDTSYEQHHYYELPGATPDTLSIIRWWQVEAQGDQVLYPPEAEERATHRFRADYQEAEKIPDAEVAESGLVRPQGGQRWLLVRGRDKAAVEAAVVKAVEALHARKEERGYVW